MKNMISILAATFIGFGVGYLVIGHFKEMGFQIERMQWKNEMERKTAHPVASLDSTNALPGVSAPTNPKTSLLKGQEILKRLAELRPQIGSKKQSVRQIIHLLQTLVELGPESFDAIRGFLAQYQDVDYNVNGELARPGSRGAQVTRTQPLSDFILPPSLRLGLVDVLQEIGGAEAEKILADMLMHSGRAVEVVYVAKILEEIAPKKYREAALTAAKELLVNPPAMEKSASLDENSSSYLYELINGYQDTSFGSQAQRLLITSAGQIDRNALNYLSEHLKDQAGPALYHAFNDPRVENAWDKTMLLSAALPYVGANSYIDALFAQVLTNASISSQLRNYAIQNLSGVPRGILTRGVMPDNSLLETRIAWLQNMRNSVNDSNAVLAIDETMHRIRQTMNRLSLPVQQSPTNR